MEPPGQMPTFLRENGWARDFHDEMATDVLSVDDPDSMSGKYLATFHSRHFEKGDLRALPDGRVVLSGDAAPGWTELHQIIQIKTLGSPTSTPYYAWHSVFDRRFASLLLDPWRIQVR